MQLKDKEIHNFNPFGFSKSINYLATFEGRNKQALGALCSAFLELNIKDDIVNMLFRNYHRQRRLFIYWSVC